MHLISAFILLLKVIGCLALLIVAIYKNFYIQIDPGSGTESWFKLYLRHIIGKKPKLNCAARLIDRHSNTYRNHLILDDLAKNERPR